MKRLIILLFFVSILLVMAGCTPKIYLQNTNKMPKEEVAVLRLFPSWAIGTNTLIIDGVEIPKNRHVRQVYLLPGIHEIEHDAHGLGKCIRYARVHYIGRTGATVKRQIECQQYERVKWVRKGELMFEASYEYDYSCYRHSFPVVKGRVGEAEEISKRVCSRKESSKRKIE